MVIVHPDQITILNILCDGFCEQAVRFCVGLPGRLFERDLSRVVVEQWP